MSSPFQPIYSSLKNQSTEITYIESLPSIHVKQKSYSNQSWKVDQALTKLPKMRQGFDENDNSQALHDYPT